MKKNKEISHTLLLEQEVIQLSYYAAVIESILAYCSNLSQVKLLILAFLIKSRTISDISVFDGRARKNILSKAVRDAAGSLTQLCNEIQYFIRAERILIETGAIEYFDGNLSQLSCNKTHCINLGTFEKKLIDECAEERDESVVLEVLRNV